MNRADVISMARKSGAVFDQRYIGEVAFISKDALERFAALVAAAERERCAKVCEDRGNRNRIAASLPNGDRDEFYYADEFDGDVERSLAEDTIPLFDSDDYEIQDWAVNNMNWSDFNGHQVKVAEAITPDFQDAWMNGEKGFVT